MGGKQACMLSTTRPCAGGVNNGHHAGERAVVPSCWWVKLEKRRARVEKERPLHRRCPSHSARSHGPAATCGTPAPPRRSPARGRRRPRPRCSWRTDACTAGYRPCSRRLTDEAAYTAQVVYILASSRCLYVVKYESSRLEAAPEPSDMYKFEMVTVGLRIYAPLQPLSICNRSTS